MTQFVIIISLVMLVVIVCTVLIEKKHYKNQFVKYVPFVITLLFGLVCLAKAMFFTNSSTNFTFIVLATYNLVAALCSLMTIAITMISRMILRRR